MKYDTATLQRLYQEKGGSFFLYDLDAMEKHLCSLATPGVRLWYACKANPLSRVIDAAKNAGLSFDVASLGELKQVLSRGVPGKEILLTGPGKSEKFLRFALENGVRTFVLESERQLQLLQKIAEELQLKADALLRLQLSWSEEEKSVLGGGNTSVFGQDIASWKKVQFTAAPHVNVLGFHVFQWGNLLDEKRIHKVWLRIANEARALAADLKIPLQVLDLGGGLGIPYRLGAQELDFAKLQESLSVAKAESGASELWLELGRYAVGDFGIYVTEILDRKTTYGKEFLVCNGGSHHILRSALVGESFPCTALMGEATQKYAVHGPLCTALDFLGEHTLPATLVPGELLVFHKVGAYGFTESMPFFLCHELPAEIILYKGALETIREISTAETWLK